MRLYVVIGIILALGGGATYAADWDSCADDLDRLRRTARDAADIAEQAKSKASELENCRSYPSSYDLMRDRCRSYAADLEGEASRLQSELDDLDRRIRSVNGSCGVRLGSVQGPRPSRPATGNTQCDVYRSYKGRLSEATLLQACIKGLSEAECKKCLAN